MIKEKIICSAIHYDDGNYYMGQDVYKISSGFVIGGFRHQNIISVVATNNYYEHPEMHLIQKKNGVKYKTIQGFITSLGRFVDREEGAEVAFKAKQTSKKLKTLFSEDIYPD